MNTVDHYASMLTQDHQLCETSLTLVSGGFCLRLWSNSSKLISQLANYFSHVVTTKSLQADVEVIAVEREAPDLPIDFIDWKREPGKTGRKDSYFDFKDGRLLRKVRTGMVFLQSARQLIAAGPCLQYDNQLINFINSQYMNWLQQKGWLICHAAGIVHNNRCMAMAGLSGGGKSTLMLSLLERDDINYLTNDRLFIRKAGVKLQAAGIPKLPRINPGTIVHNPRLNPLIDAERREQLRALPVAELWHLEEKFDVSIDRFYGKNRIQPDADLASILILHWHHDATEPSSLNEVQLDQRTDLLAAIMKSPGPFYQRSDGTFLKDDEPLQSEPYLEILQNIRVYELTGRIDFEAALQLIMPLMEIS
ncbi:MAG TPA: HprK-related kinase B [Gammaproteobacteria bacterium]|jgi:HprK-related kinase B